MLKDINKITVEQESRSGSLELSDDQFIKIRRDSRGYAIEFLLVQKGGRGRRWTFRQETKIEKFKELLSDKWAADVLAGMINNLVLGAFRKHSVNGHSPFFYR